MKISCFSWYSDCDIMPPCLLHHQVWVVCHQNKQVAYDLFLKGWEGQKNCPHIRGTNMHACFMLCPFSHCHKLLQVSLSATLRCIGKHKERRNVESVCKREQPEEWVCILLTLALARVECHKKSLHTLAAKTEVVRVCHEADLHTLLTQVSSLSRELTLSSMLHTLHHNRTFVTTHEQLTAPCKVQVSAAPLLL